VQAVVAACRQSCRHALQQLIRGQSLDTFGCKLFFELLDDFPVRAG
jgi:hypothetical protein